MFEKLGGRRRTVTFASRRSALRNDDYESAGGRGPLSSSVYNEKAICSSVRQRARRLVIKMLLRSYLYRKFYRVRDLAAWKMNFRIRRVS